MAAAALRSTDGAVVSVLISSLAEEPRNLSLRVRGLERATALVMMLDERADLAPRPLAAPVSRGKALELELTVAPLSSAWVVLR